MPPRHSHPLIQQIDAGLDSLDSAFESFARSHSYEFCKSVDGDFNPPRRQLHRLPKREGFNQIVSLHVVGRDPKTNAPPPFGPEMPCTLTAFASALVGERWKCLRQEIVSAVPFCRLSRELSFVLETAHRKLEEWSYEKVAAEGWSE